MKKVFVLLGLCGILISCTSKQTYYYVHDPDGREGMYITFTDSAFWESDKKGNQIGDRYYLYRSKVVANFTDDTLLYFRHNRCESYKFAGDSARCDSLTRANRQYRFALVSSNYKYVAKIQGFFTFENGKWEAPLEGWYTKRWIRSNEPQE
jgi:hypothetical protein